MYHSSVRSTTASTARPVVVIVAILSMLLSALAVASPVMATDEVDTPADHCADKDNVNKVNADSNGDGTTTINNVVITSDGNTLSFTNNNATSATINWCAKGGTGFYGTGEATSKNTGPQVTTVGAGLTTTVTFNPGKNVSYFIPYTVTVVPPVDECPGQGGELASYHYTVNGGVVTYLDLDLIPDLQGSELTTHFVIAAGCEDIELSLDSNTAMGATWETSRPQGDFDADTGLFDAGSHTLTVNVPDCFYQVDFVWGGLLTAAQINADTLYGDRKIDWRNGGEGECGGEEPDETSVLQVDKIVCEAADSSTTFEGPVYVPIVTKDLAVQGGDGGLPADCEHGAGVTFTVLLDANEDGIGEGPAVSPDLAADGSFTTDAGGGATIMLTVGTYVLVEPATDGFPGGTIMFEIRVDDATLIFVRNDVGVIGSLLIAKEDDEGDPLGGAGFTLDDDATAHLDTDEDGFVCIDGLELGGLYDISETVVPDGYEGGADQSDVEVTVDADCETRTEGADATFVNIPEEDESPPPTTNQPPRGGTLGGNPPAPNPPLPNTAMSPAPLGSVPAFALALIMLTGLGAALVVARGEARRRL